METKEELYDRAQALIERVDIDALERGYEALVALAEFAQALEDAVYFLEGAADDRCNATHIDQDLTAKQLGKLLTMVRGLS